MRHAGLEEAVKNGSIDGYWRGWTPGLPRALSQQSGGEDQVLMKNCGVIKLLGYVFAE